MTAGNFAKCLAYVLQEEGGYVNNPRDPGGATNKGVTQAVYDAYRVKHGKAKQPVIKIASDEVSEIYRAEYWNAVKGDSLPAGVDYATFDLAVNSGVGRAARFLQAAASVTQDGQIGPKTIAAIKYPKAVTEALCDKRESFLRSLDTFPTFGRGWIARVDRVRSRARDMA